MQAFQPAPKAWLHGSAETVPSASPHAQQVSTLATELSEALAITTRAERGLGDAFVFGRCTDQYESALVQAMPAEARVFGCADRSARVGRGRTWLDVSEFEEGTLRAFRARHHVRRVSVVVVADDFAWSLGRVVHGLCSLLGNHASLLVAGRQAALLESLWLDELRSGQRDFDVSRMDVPASSWARFVLRRRQFA